MYQKFVPHLTVCTVVVFCGLCAVFLPFAVSGCGSGGGCSTSVEPGIVVHLTDADAGTPAGNDATVVVTDGNYRETLRDTGVLTNEDGSTTIRGYFGAQERPGNYTVHVTRPGYASAERTNIAVTKGPCHVNTQTLNIALTPQ